VARLLSQEELAEAAGLSVRTLRNLEAGSVRRPRGMSVRLLADALGLDGAARVRFERAAVGAAPEQPPDGTATVAGPHELPPRLPEFAGRRSELDEVLAAVGDGRSGPALVVIDGPPGVGKSALAVEAAWTLLGAGRFPDGQLYVNLHGSTPGVAPVDPLSALTRMLRSLGMDAGSLPDDVEEGSARLRSLTAGRRLLVVLDNARDAGQVRPLLPAGEGCAAVVTNRTTLGFLPGSVAVTLGMMDEADGLLLFERLVGRQRVQAEPAAYQRLLAYCGRLPLALQIAGRRLAGSPAWTAGQYADLARDEHHRLDTLRFGDREVRNTLALSYSMLAAESRPAARAFRLLASFDVPDISMGVLCAALGVTPHEAAAVVQRLADANLVHSPRPAHVAYHDLLKVLARERSRQEDSAAERRAAVGRAVRACLAGVVAAVRTFRPGTARVAVAVEADWPAGPSFRDSAEAQAWLEGERANLVALIVQAARDDAEVDLAAALCTALFPYMDLHAHWDDALPALRAVVEAGRRSGRRAAEASTLSDISWVLIRRGRRQEALSCLREGLEIAGELGDRRGEANVRNVLGVVYKSTGEFDRAVTEYTRTLALRRDLGFRSEQANTLTNLGNLYSCLGRYDEAIACHEEQLALSEDMGDHRGVAIGLVNLGDELSNLGRLDDADAMLRRGIAMCDVSREETLQAMALTFLAKNHRRQGRVRQAASLAADATALFTERRYPRGEADASRELGAALAALGSTSDARHFLQRALDLYTDLGAPEVDDVKEELAAVSRRSDR
jgi:tetratricopeptide (TPR) repeat protein/transcriptional regulator with XRE-family HTH domain